MIRRGSNIKVNIKNWPYISLNINQEKPTTYKTYLKHTKNKPCGFNAKVEFARSRKSIRYMIDD